jgi:hypothetical protein
MSKYKLNEDVSVLFKNGFNFVELKITLQDLIQNTEEELFELLEERESPCTCNINESVPFCECGGAFDDYEIVEIEIVKEKQ